MDERVLKGLEPEAVFRWFERICGIPHGSFHEQALSNYLKSWAEQQGYECRQDADWNLRIEVPASAGCENRPKVILQAHMDMVCSKADGSSHNFETDPIRISYRDGWIRADGTTLGADDGIAVACILAAIEDLSLAHPAIQVVLTASEEVACIGAGNLDPDWLDGKYLINMDIFRDDALMVSCAGISINRIEIDANRQPVADAPDKVAIDLSVTGLEGGHSGEMIHEGRANALGVLGELLDTARRTKSAELLSAYGEGVFNAICAAAGASLACPEADAASVTGALEKVAAVLCQLYERTDPNMRIQVQTRALREDETCLLAEQADRLIDLLYTAPLGMNMPHNNPVTVAESSSNFGSLQEEDGVLTLVMSIRSNPEYRHDQMLRKYEILCGRIGARMTTDRRIGSWEYMPVSPLRETARAVYERQNGQPPELIIVHSGVEVATFIGKMAERGRTLDAVAFGFHIVGAHSPEERLEVASVEKGYRLLRGILSEIR